MMARAALVLFVSAGLAACQTTAKREISDFPEARSYMDCVKGRAAAYAGQPDSAVDLAIIAVGACSSKEYAMEQAIRQENSALFTSEFMRRNRRTMTNLAAEYIIETRRRK